MIKLFSGSAHPQLAKDVAKLSGVPLSPSEVVRFENSEVRVRIEDDVAHSRCFVIQPTANPTDTNLMELFFFCDALRRQEAKRVIGIIPYFGYARQDIQHRTGECVSSSVVIRFLETIGFHKIYTFDLHDEATQGVFSIPFKNITTFSIIAEEAKKYIQEQQLDQGDVTIVSPDQSGIERARKFGISFFKSEDFRIAVTEKKRDQDRIHKSKALDLYGDVKNKIVILVDDIATSAGTLINSAILCKQNGAKHVIAAVAHHDFSPSAPQRLQDSEIDIFLTTDTIALKEEQKFPKLKELSIAPLIADLLKDH